MEIAGRIKIENETLEMMCFPELVYVPATKGNAGGLYDCKGQAIPSAINHRGNISYLSGPIDNKIDINKLHLDNNVKSHFFIGDISPHFGHFLLESTSRLWPLLNKGENLTDLKYLYCSSNPNHGFFRKSFIKDIFGCFSLQAQEFVAYREPCRIKNVFIAPPAFEIRHHSNVIFRQLMRHIGTSLAGNLDSINNANTTPLYLSKSKLTKGVSGITNEIEIEMLLKQEGVDILHPETLSLENQIKELTNRKYLIGFVGSALHTLLFCPGDKVISGIVLGEKLNANYVMIDQLARNKGHYELAGNVNVVACDESTPGFMRTFYANDPKLAAQILLKNILSV